MRSHGPVLSRLEDVIADLLYHMLVLLAQRGVPVTRVMDVLAARGA